MSIFSKIGHDISHAVKDVGKGIEKVAKGVAEGVETVGKTLGKDVINTAEASLESADALMHGHLQDALNKAMQAGEDLAKTGTDLDSAGAHIALDSLGDMHLSKKLDSAVGKVNKAYSSVQNDVNNSVDQVANQVVSGTEGAIKGTVGAVNDAAHGKWGAAAGALGGATMDALNVASDLTPEGAAAAIGTQALMNAHIGNAQIDSAIGGALHGNVTQMAKGIVKNVGEAELGDKASEAMSDIASKVSNGSSNGDAALAMGLSVAAGAIGGNSGSSGSKHSHGEAGGESTHSISTAGRSAHAAGHEAGRAGEAEEPESKEAKGKEKDDADDNAQAVANNTANNDVAEAGGGDAQLEQEMMFELFLMQAGMSSQNKQKEGLAQLSSDS